MRILEDGFGQARLGRRRGQNPSQIGQPRLAPARVVAAGVPVGLADVDLLPGALADVADDQFAARAERGAVRVAQPDRVDRRLQVFREDGVRLRHAVGRFAGRVAGVDPQDLAEEVADSLGIRAVGVVAEGDVEETFGPEHDLAAVVVAGAVFGAEHESAPSPGSATFGSAERWYSTILICPALAEGSSSSGPAATVKT